MNLRTLVLVAFLLHAIHPKLVGDDSKWKLQKIYEGVEVTRPVTIQIPGDGTNRRFLIEQTGKMKILPEEGKGGEASVFLDLTDSIEVENDFEEGFLGLAFHPKFKENGRFYLTYSRQGPKRLVLAEYTVSKTNPNLADPESERILLEVQEPEWNHNSGNLLFDPRDGMLFFTVGDGGMRNGVHHLSQKLTSWCGKVLRIDVDSRTGKRPYGIPSDNPFLETPFAAPEIWAFGLRNPWGISIDVATDAFYLADVGQDLYEEINLIEKGGNYGWNYKEATHLFQAREALAAALGRSNKFPKDAVFIEPIHEYDRTGGLSVTGGFVYRGQAMPELQGYYLFGDWRFGNLWALSYDFEKQKVVENLHIEKPADVAEPVAQPTGIYPDENGEPIVLDWRGAIFRLVPNK